MVRAKHFEAEIGAISYRQAYLAAKLLTKFPKRYVHGVQRREIQASRNKSAKLGNIQLCNAEASVKDL